MNIIVCLDDRDGMSFCGRRQSMDRVLRSRAVELAGEGKLWMCNYSAGQFSDHPDRIVSEEDFLAKAPEDAWCFLEDRDITPYAHQVRQLAVFRWNRLYPSDRRFPLSLFSSGWKLLSREEFPGNSHENITMEVYRI